MHDVRMDMSANDLGKLTRKYMTPDRSDPREKKKPANVRIIWARSLSNEDISDLLQMKLLESRAERGTQVSLLNELVHEIKFRLNPKGSAPRENDDA